MIRLNITPFCCRTKYQKALSRLLEKLEFKLHRELDFAPHLRKFRDTTNYVRSFTTSKVFDRENLI